MGMIEIRGSGVFNPKLGEIENDEKVHHRAYENVSCDLMITSVKVSNIGNNSRIV